MMKVKIMAMKAANVYGGLPGARCGTEHVTSLCRGQSHR